MRNESSREQKGARPVVRMFSESFKANNCASYNDAFTKTTRKDIEQVLCPKTRRGPHVEQGTGPRGKMGSK